MRPLSSAELLEAWEQGLSKPQAFRTLAMLDAAGAADASAGTLSVGARDLRLLQLRVWAFGRQLPSTATCPRCQERVEWSVDASLLLDEAHGAPDSDELFVEVEERTVRFRLPNTFDLEAAATCGTVEAARRQLIERCLIEATPPIDRGDVPSAIAEAMASRMAEVDPGSLREFSLTCPICGHAWTLLFDIESFFWSEVHGWAQRTLKDVHMLATAYGWSEAEILRMGPARRHAYLELIGA